PTHGLDDNHKVLFRLARHDAEETRKLGFKKAPVEGEFAACEHLRLCAASFLLLGRREGKPALASLAGKSGWRFGRGASGIGGDGLLRPGIGVAMFDA